MASKTETRKRREEMRQIFGEVCQIARATASPILCRALDEYQLKFEELIQPRKQKDNGVQNEE